MRPKIALVLLLLAAYAPASFANNAPFTCTELALFAHSLTTARDKGTSLQRVQQIVSEDSNFTHSDKVAFKKLAVRIYDARTITPDNMAVIAKRECIKTGKRKP